MNSRTTSQEEAAIIALIQLERVAPGRAHPVLRGNPHHIKYNFAIL